MSFPHKQSFSYKNVFRIATHVFVATVVCGVFSQPALAAGACTGTLTASVSYDKITYGSTATVPANQPTRYYVKVLQNDTGCSTNFDVYWRVCDAGNVNCGAYMTGAWGVLHSDDAGITRADVYAPLVPNKVFQMQLRPAGRTDIPWSNQVEIRVSGTADPVNVDTSPYLVYEPGFSWIYDSRNFETGEAGTTRIQIEEETNICSIVVRPWRFTKNIQGVYWNVNLARDLRWMIVKPSFTYTEIPVFNNFFWGLGDKNYTRTQSATALRDIFPSALSHAHIYRSKTGRVPAYNLLKKMIQQNYAYIDRASGESYYPPVTDIGAGGCSLLAPAGAGITGSWLIRTEHLPALAVNGRSYNDVLRVDYYEGGTPLETARNLLRESWYFARNIGLVQIKEKLFNDYGGPEYPDCATDPDCLNDEMQHPRNEVLITKYFQNPTLQVLVSRDNITYGSTATTTTAIGYYLKINNTPYTGYLEALAPGRSASKWLWAEDGLAFVPPSLLTGFPPGDYLAQFRIWVPNEVFPNETRVGDTAIPWSNSVTVSIVTALPTSTPSPSLTPTQTPIPTATITPSPTPIPLAGDLNNDRVVNIQDVLTFISRLNAGQTATIFTYTNVVADYGKLY